MDRKAALKEAMQAGLNELEKLEQEGVEGLVHAATDSGDLVEATWPVVEAFRGREEEFHEFSERMAERFPGYELAPFGGSVFDYVMGNIRNAVLAEVMQRLKARHETLCEAERQSAFRSVPKRDWKVAKATVTDCISEVRTMIG